MEPGRRWCDRKACPDYGIAGAGNINVFDPNTGAYLGQMRQPNGAPVAISGLWDLEFGDGTPDSGKTNQLFFDAGPNAPGVFGAGLFGVIRAAGDQSGNGRGDPVRRVASPAQSMQQAPPATGNTASVLGTDINHDDVLKRDGTSII